MIYDDGNYHSLLGDRSETLKDGSICPVHVESTGEKRYMALMPTESGKKIAEAMPKFADYFPTYSREECFERWKEQEAGRLYSIEDWQDFDPHDQNGLPSCWRNGSAHGFTTQNVIMGRQLRMISANSLCPNISFHVGGDEWNSAMSLIEDGGATQDVVANNETNSAAFRDPKVAESRKHGHALQAYRFSGDQGTRQLQMMTAMCMEMPMCGGIAFNWWSHVISLCRFWFTGSTSTSSVVNRHRNNWGPWGAKNKFGRFGYVDIAEGHGTPDSGHVYGPPLTTAA